MHLKVVDYSRKALFAIYRNRSEVNESIKALRLRGIKDSDIHVLTSPYEGGSKDFSQRQRTLVKTGAMVGAVIGVVVIGLLSVLISNQTIPIPGAENIGNSLREKVLISLSGFIMGGFIGAGVGALIGIGTPEPAGYRYSTYIGAGGILLSVHVHNESEEKNVRDLLEATGGQDITFLDEDEGWHMVREGSHRLSG